MSSYIMIQIDISLYISIYISIYIFIYILIRSRRRMPRRMSCWSRTRGVGLLGGTMLRRHRLHGNQTHYQKDVCVYMQCAGSMSVFGTQYYTVYINDILHSVYSIYLQLCTINSGYSTYTRQVYRQVYNYIQLHIPVAASPVRRTLTLTLNIVENKNVYCPDYCNECP